MKNTIFRIIVCLICYSSNPVGAAMGGFVQNKGQYNDLVLFKADIPGGTLYIENGTLHYIYYNQSDWEKCVRHPVKKNGASEVTVRYHNFRVNFVGASFNTIYTLDTLPGRLHFHYMYKSTSNVMSFQRILIKNAWEGIDIEFIYNSGNFKYNYIIHPGISASRIKTRYIGVSDIQLTSGKNLKINTSVNQFSENLPAAWNDKNLSLKAGFVLNENMLGVLIENENINEFRTIDPVLVFSTYSGSTVDNFGFTATYDSQGCLYAGGIASEPTKFPNGRYPTTTGAFQYTYGGGDKSGWEGFPCDISITKYTPDGSAIEWASYLGGSKNEYPHSIVVDQHDQLIVFGTTTSDDFPVTKYGFDTTHNGGFDIILTRFNFDGSRLEGSTYIGGTKNDGFNVGGPLKYNYADEFRGEVDVDSYGNIYVASCTYSKDFPVNTGGTPSDSLEAVMMKFDSTLSNPAWISYWGKRGHDAFYSVEIYRDTIVYFGGSTTSLHLPVDSLAIDTSYQGGRADGYIAAFTNDSLKFLRATYIGTGDYNQVYFIEQDIKGKIYATGQTDGTWPVIGSVFSQANSGQFILKISPDLRQTILSTAFGSGSYTADLNPSAFMIDYCENVYFSGWGSDVANPSDHIGTTNGLTVSSNAIQKTTDGNDFYLIVFSKNLQNIAYATYFGSNSQPFESSDHVDGGTSRFDPRGVIYQSVCSSCPSLGGVSQISNFPTTSNAYSKTNPSPRCSNASFKIDFQITNAVIADFILTPSVQCSGQPVTIINKSTGGKNFYWDFGDGKSDTARNPSHVFYQGGEYNVRLIIYDSNSCNVFDTAYRTIKIAESAQASMSMLLDTCKRSVRLNNTSFVNLGTFWDFGDGNSDSGTISMHKYVSSGIYKIRMITNYRNTCADTLDSVVVIQTDTLVKAGFSQFPDSGCLPLQVNFTSSSSANTTHIYDMGDGIMDTARNPVHIYNTPGIYLIKLIVRDNNNCGLSDTATDSVEVYKKVKSYFEIALRKCELSISFSNIPDRAQPYFWNFGDGTTDTLKNPQHTYKEGGNYTISLITGAGTHCPDTFIKMVNLQSDSSGKLLIPNAFTPDNDGWNDCFKPAGLQENCDRINMYIYDIWGMLLYSTDKVNNCWDGKNFDGKDVTEGTYYYLIETQKGDNEPVLNKGALFLSRKK